MLFLAGEAFNLLTSASGSATSEDSLYPLSNLSIGSPSRPFRFGSAATNVNTTFDLELLQDPGIESWSGGSPTAWLKWTPGSSTVTQDTNAAFEGSSSARLKRLSTSESSVIYQDRQVSAGQRLTVRYALKSASAGTRVDVSIHNLTTSRRLRTDGTWSNTFVTADQYDGASWSSREVTFTLEPFSTTLASPATLRLELWAGGAAGFDLWVDDVSLVPAVDFVSLHGHNMDGLIVPELWSSSDNFAEDDVLEATLSPKSPTFFSRLPAERSRRYWRLIFKGTNSAPLWLGEAVLGYATRAQQPPQYGWRTTYDWPTVEQRTPTGERWIAALSDASRRSLNLRFQHSSQAGYDELRQELIERSKGGRLPVVVVPDEAGPEVLLGNIGGEFEVTRNLPGLWEHDLVLEELPLPLMNP